MWQWIWRKLSQFNFGKTRHRIDVDEDVIKYARKRYSSLSDSLSFIKANAMDLNTIQTASICSIVSVETIERIPDPDKALSEFFRVLDPKGVLFITTPDATKHPNRRVSQFHIREYTPIQFQKLLEQHFRSINISTDGVASLGYVENCPRHAKELEKIMGSYLVCMSEK
jgi:ubiquinone/menaquinone biosynthesis C-methylase UbiE